MTRLPALLTAAALAACTPTPAANDTGAAAPTGNMADMAGEIADACDAARVGDAVGKRAEAVRADVLTRSGARTVRIIAPGQAVTMDYRTDRLNLETDANGVVTAVRCG